MAQIGKKITTKLKKLDEVIDRGLLAGSQERRDGKRYMRDLFEIARTIRDAEAAERIAKKGGS